jgi:hypothetical protein
VSGEAPLDAKVIEVGLEESHSRSQQSTVNSRQWSTVNG